MALLVYAGANASEVRARMNKFQVCVSGDDVQKSTKPVVWDRVFCAIFFAIKKEAACAVSAGTRALFGT